MYLISRLQSHIIVLLHSLDSVLKLFVKFRWLTAGVETIQ